MKRTKRRRRRRRRTRKKGSGLWTKFKNWRKGRGWREPTVIVLHHGQNAQEVEPTVENNPENTEIVGILRGNDVPVVAPKKSRAARYARVRAGKTASPVISQYEQMRQALADRPEIRAEHSHMPTFIGQGENRRLVISPHTRTTKIPQEVPLSPRSAAVRKQYRQDGKTSPINTQSDLWDDEKEDWVDSGFKYEKYKEPKKKEKDLAQHAMKLEFGGTRKIRKRRKRRKRYRRSRRRRRRKKRR